MPRSTALHTITTGASAIATPVIVPSPRDALSSPSNDDLITAGLALWPQGPAWGSPDGQAVDLASNLARFTRVLVSNFEWLYARAFKLWEEATLSGVSELLSEWERDYGLPDDCLAGQTGVELRMWALRLRVSGLAPITPHDFIALAESCGFEIEIKEAATFQCGFSECGGEHETGSAREESFWQIRVVGVDPDFSIGEPEQMLCVLRRLAPAWTMPVLWWDPETFILGTGDEEALMTGDNEIMTITV